MKRAPDGSLRFTLVLEFGPPVQWKPGYFISDSMYRVWWLWFAVGLLRVSFREFSETSYMWAETTDYTIRERLQSWPVPARLYKYGNVEIVPAQAIMWGAFSAKPIIGTKTQKPILRLARSGIAMMDGASITGTACRSNGFSSARTD